jgi:hypothetical protein
MWSQNSIINILLMSTILHIDFFYGQIIFKIICFGVLNNFYFNSWGLLFQMSVVFFVSLKRKHFM